MFWVAKLVVIMEKGKPEMIKLVSTNYRSWKSRMEDLLYYKDLATPIENDGVMPAEMKEADWKRLDRKACGFIRYWIDDSVIHHVEEETTAIGVWKKLDEMYSGKTSGSKVQLIKKLSSMKYVDGTSIAEHLNEFQNVLIQLKQLKINFGDEVEALFVLSSLPESWETLHVSLGNSAPNGIVSMALVTNSLFGGRDEKEE